MGGGVFSNCSSLTSITLHAQITTIKSYTFFNNDSLESITLPPSLTTIGDFAFCGCKSLESIEIPSSVTTLGDGVFAGCKSLSYITKLQSTVAIGHGVFGGSESIPHYEKFIKEAKAITIKDNYGPGSQHGFQGELLRGYGPEKCGVTLAQIQQLKDHPSYWDDKYLMRDYVRDIVEPLTDGTGLSYALLRNKDNPLTAKVMVSHAWDESIRQFVEAIERSKEEGPFWVCVLSIYQNNDPSKGPTISQQLGSDPQFGPFATVLKEVKEQGLMLAVLTSGCDIYTRLWCVYEIFFAVERGVKVKLAPHISEHNLKNGRTENDICVNEANIRVDSEKARCGAPETPQNEDEIAIRNTINASNGGFELVNKTVERIRLIHLLSYPVGDINYNKATARDKIKQAIENILPCFADEGQLKTFDEFLEEQLSARPGFERSPRDREEIIGDHNYYIRNKGNGNEKLDVFKMWSKSILKIIKPSTSPTTDKESIV